MAECIEREALLHDIEQSVVYTAREKITSAEMRGAHKIIERIKCAPAVEPIYIREPTTKSEFKRMAAQLGYEQVVHCMDCEYKESIEGYGNNGGYCVLHSSACAGYCGDGKYKHNTEGIK